MEGFQFITRSESNRARFYINRSFTKTKQKLIVIRKTLVFCINVVERGRIFAYGLIFFFVCSKQKGFVKKGTEFLFLSIFWVVLDQKHFFSWTIRLSAFPLKISRKMDDRDIVILSIYFSRRMIWKKKLFFYIRKTNVIICHYHVLGQKSKKKSQIWKKLFSPPTSFISRTTFKYP